MTGSSLLGVCGRFSQYSPVSDLVRVFGVDESLVDAEVERARYNVAPTQPALVVTDSAGGQGRKLAAMRWGLVPGWATDPKIGNRMINARAERVATSNAYRSAFAKRRCIVPVDGFYEWARPAPAPGVAKPPKRPFHIHGGDSTPLALAGLWETWRDADDVALRTFTIITCDANDAMASIHDRMPVILPAADWSTWLAPTPLTDTERERLLTPAPNELLVFDEVSTRVNRPTNDSADLITPI